MARIPKKLFHHLSAVLPERIKTLNEYIDILRNGPSEGMEINPWLKDKTPEYFEGIIEGYILQIEDMLHLYGCYGGYNDYPDGRRYYVKGVCDIATNYFPAKKEG